MVWSYIQSLTTDKNYHSAKRCQIQDSTGLKITSGRSRHGASLQQFFAELENEEDDPNGGINFNLTLDEENEIPVMIQSGLS